jgi:hypothetical protein
VGRKEWAPPSCQRHHTYYLEPCPDVAVLSRHNTAGSMAPMSYLADKLIFWRLGGYQGNREENVRCIQGLFGTEHGNRDEMWLQQLYTPRTINKNLALVPTLACYPAAVLEWRLALCCMQDQNATHNAPKQATGIYLCWSGGEATMTAEHTYLDDGLRRLLSPLLAWT